MRVLGALPQEDAGAALIALAGRGSETLRQAVVKALGDSTAVDPPQLLAAMAQVDKQETGRYADLVRALVPSIRRRPDHHPAVLATLRGALGPTRDFEVRARAVMAHGDLRAPEGTGDLA